LIDPTDRSHPIGENREESSEKKERELRERVKEESFITREEENS